MRYKPSALHGIALASMVGAALAIAPAMAQNDNNQTTTTNPGNPNNPGDTGNMGNPGNMGSQQGTQSADEVINPTSTLAGDNVQDSTGQMIGTVRSVTTGPNGRASRVSISLTRGAGRTVWIRANRLHFDPASNTLRSSLSLSQISSMPSSTQLP